MQEARGEMKTRTKLILGTKAGGPGRRTRKTGAKKLHTYRFSHTGTPASFSLMYAGRFIQSSDSAGSFT